MKKHNLLKSLILVMAVLTSTVKAFGYAEVEQAVTLSVQPSVSIEKTTSNESGSIEPSNGQNTGLSASFVIQTNGTDEDYEFIVGSQVTSVDGEVPAFTQDGSLIFGNTTSLPSTSAIENAILHGGENRNVIAYPVTMTISTPMSVDFVSNSASYGNCYQVKVNTGTEGTLTQVIGQSPVAGTYSIGQDESGTYQATVYFTAVSK